MLQRRALRANVNHTPPERRFHDVRNEGFIAEFGDIHFAFFASCVWEVPPASAHPSIFPLQQLPRRAAQGNGAEVQAVVPNFVRDIPGEHAVHAQLHAGVSFRNLAAQAGARGWNSHSHRAKVHALHPPAH